MRAVFLNFLLLFVLQLIIPVFSQAQKESATIIQSKRYLDINIKSLTKYTAKVEKQQQKLLNKLKRKEKRFADKLKKNDSAGYVRYQQQELSYDSISKITPETPSAAKRVSGRTNRTIDSLKVIQSYLENKTHKIRTDERDNPSIFDYTNKLSQQNSRLNYNSYINDLIGQRTNTLKSISGENRNLGFKAIDKTIFYSNGKINAYKNIADELSKLEERALEYLQGEEGFGEYLAGGGSKNSMALAGGTTSIDDLEKMGYQTKRQLNEQLMKKTGGNMTGIQDKMFGQITEWKDKTKSIKQVKNEYKQAKQSIHQVRNTNKPSFKVNPMRELPFWQRVEKQYNWQTTRATLDGQPAILQLSAMAGFKHTPKLTYGLGVVSSFGLGQNWNNIHFSFEGIGIKSYATWQWQYGVGAYTGYERMWKQAVLIGNSETSAVNSGNTHNTNKYSDAMLIGLTKSYHINDKWTGAIQVLYDVWWKDKGLRSPIQLRISTISK